MLLLSANGTLRTILILLIVWLLLRAWVRSRQPAQGGRPKGTHWASPDDRSKGDVRIERTEDTRKARPGPVEDADFEEIK